MTATETETGPVITPTGRLQQAFGATQQSALQAFLEAAAKDGKRVSIHAEFDRMSRNEVWQSGGEVTIPDSYAQQGANPQVVLDSGSGGSMFDRVRHFCLELGVYRGVDGAEGLQRVVVTVL
jgi:hypothetical protein